MPLQRPLRIGLIALILRKISWFSRIQILSLSREFRNSNVLYREDAAGDDENQRRTTTISEKVDVDRLHLTRNTDE